MKQLCQLFRIDYRFVEAGNVWRLYIAIPTQEEKMKPKIPVAIPRTPFCDRELQGNPKSPLAVITDAAILKVQYCWRNTHFCPPNAINVSRKRRGRQVQSHRTVVRRLPAATF